MKSLLFKLGVILISIGLIICGYAELCNAQNWVSDGQSYKEGKKTGDIYYDPNFQKTESGTIVIKVKYVYTDWGIKDKLKRVKNFPNNCKFDIAQYEVKCETKELKCLRTQYFDSNGVLLIDDIETNPTVGEPEAWEKPLEKSIGGRWLRMICGF